MSRHLYSCVFLLELFDLEPSPLALLACSLATCSKQVLSLISATILFVHTCFSLMPHSYQALFFLCSFTFNFPSCLSIVMLFLHFLCHRCVANGRFMPLTSGTALLSCLGSPCRVPFPPFSIECLLCILFDVSVHSWEWFQTAKGSFAACPSIHILQL